MKKFKFVIDTGFAGCKYENIVELDDDVTEDELDIYLYDMINQYIYGNYEEVDGEDEI